MLEGRAFFGKTVRHDLGIGDLNVYRLGSRDK